MTFVNVKPSQLDGVAKVDGNRSRSRANRQEQIIRESALLFERVGYHRASMQMVAEAVNLGKPTLYHYFSSKNEILFAIHEHLISALLDRHAARVAEGQLPDALLHGMCTDILTQIDEHPGYTRAFLEHHDELDDEQKKAIRRQRTQYLELVRDVIDSGAKSGAFRKRDTQLVALGFLGMCNWAYKWFPRQSDHNVEETARVLCDVFLDGLKV